MLHRDRELLQTAILSGAQGAERQTQEEIGAAAGADRSTVSKWGSGDREMSLSNLDALAKRYGAVAILGPIADRYGCDVTPRAGVVTACPRLAAVNVVVASAELNALIHATWADNVKTPAEEAAIAAKIREVVEMVHGVGSAARKAS